nr:hypothetical protein [Anaerolineae bacterium]
MAKKARRRTRRSDRVHIRAVGSAAWRNYLRRAQQTLQAMQRSAAEEDWAAAIAAADAVVARIAGVAARDEDHAAAVELLLAHGNELEGVQRLLAWAERQLEGF